MPKYRNKEKLKQNAINVLQNANAPKIEMFSNPLFKFCTKT